MPRFVPVRDLDKVIAFLGCRFTHPHSPWRGIEGNQDFAKLFAIPVALAKVMINTVPVAGPSPGPDSPVTFGSTFPVAGNGD